MPPAATPDPAVPPAKIDAGKDPSAKSTAPCNVIVPPVNPVPTAFTPPPPEPGVNGITFHPAVTAVPLPPVCVPPVTPAKPT